MAFEILKDRILKDGKFFDGGVLKVDRFINHQMDPRLMDQICPVIQATASSIGETV